jgi:hypothetical protein
MPGLWQIDFPLWDDINIDKVPDRHFHSKYSPSLNRLSKVK